MHGFTRAVPLDEELGLDPAAAFVLGLGALREQRINLVDEDDRRLGLIAADHCARSLCQIIVPDHCARSSEEIAFPPCM